MASTSRRHQLQQCAAPVTAIWPAAMRLDLQVMLLNMLWLLPHEGGATLSCLQHACGCCFRPAPHLLLQPAAHLM